MNFNEFSKYSNNPSKPKLDASKQPNKATRRKLLISIGAGGAFANTLPAHWTRPIVDSVLLPAHAQTSCNTETQVGGPLIGNASGATNCQDACIAEADDLGVQLCGVSESTDSNDATICACDIDLP